MRNFLSLAAALLATSAIAGCSSHQSCLHRYLHAPACDECAGTACITAPSCAAPSCAAPSCAAPTCAAPACAAPACAAPACAAPACAAPSCAPQAFNGSSYGHSRDYKRLIGKVHRVHVPGGEWKIRYAPLDEQDKWGGSMVLAPDARIDDFEDGSYVYVEGQIIADRPSLYLTGPLYRVKQIRLADRTASALLD